MDRALPKNKKIKPAKARGYTVDLVAGLQALHAHGVVHRDIKVDNCLVDKRGVCKLADFGLAHLIEKRRTYDQSWDDSLSQGIGSRKYRAPEIFQHDRHSGFKADVWAVGCVLYSLVVGALPFDGGREKKQQVATILNEPLATRGGMRDDRELEDLLCTVLEKDPTRRLTLDRLAAHRWLGAGRRHP